MEFLRSFLFCNHFPDRVVYLDLSTWIQVKTYAVSKMSGFVWTGTSWKMASLKLYWWAKIIVWISAPFDMRVKRQTAHMPDKRVTLASSETQGQSVGLAKKVCFLKLSSRLFLPTRLTAPGSPRMKRGQMNENWIDFAPAVCSFPFGSVHVMFLFWPESLHYTSIPDNFLCRQEIKAIW